MAAHGVDLAHVGSAPEEGVGEGDLLRERPAGARCAQQRRRAAREQDQIGTQREGVLGGEHARGAGQRVGGDAHADARVERGQREIPRDDEERLAHAVAAGVEETGEHGGGGLARGERDQIARGLQAQRGGGAGAGVARDERFAEGALEHGSHRSGLSPTSAKAEPPKSCCQARTTVR